MDEAAAAAMRPEAEKKGKVEKLRTHAVQRVWDQLNGMKVQKAVDYGLTDFAKPTPHERHTALEEGKEKREYIFGVMKSGQDLMERKRQETLDKQHKALERERLSNDDKKFLTTAAASAARH